VYENFLSRQPLDCSIKYIQPLAKRFSRTPHQSKCTVLLCRATMTAMGVANCRTMIFLILTLDRDTRQDYNFTNITFYQGSIFPLWNICLIQYQRVYLFEQNILICYQLWYIILLIPVFVFVFRYLTCLHCIFNSKTRNIANKNQQKQTSWRLARHCDFSFRSRTISSHWQVYTKELTNGHLNY